MSSNTTSPTNTASCPYAAALHFHGDESDDDTSSTDTNKLIQSCPAFERGSCPFAACVGDETAVRKALLQIPASHFENSSGGASKQFMTVLQELHTVAGTTGMAQFQMTGCPVASKVPVVDSPKGGAPVNFTQAMEGYSLAAIMARMAEEMEEEEHSNSNNSDVVISEASEEAQVKQQPVTAAVDTAPDQHQCLSNAFKMGTAVSHQAAEDVHFVANFIRGEIDRDIYAELVIQLYHVYDVLETSLSVSGVEQFRDFHTQLHRTETLKEDLDFWHGPVKTAQILVDSASTISDAAKDYVERLQYCAAQDPLLLLAHSYTRYLGDLSGGKILARVARKAMNLDSQDGLAFYEFDAIPSAKKFKDAYRQALDALELTDDQILKLVSEANVAFLLNMRLFEELDVRANVPGATVRPLAEALSFAEFQKPADVNDEKPKECPFAKMGANANKTVADDASKKKIPDECPFGKTPSASSNSNAEAVAPSKKHGRCPWPFILAHDPVAALQDWQTWALGGLILCFAWYKLQ